MDRIITPFDLFQNHIPTKIQEAEISILESWLIQFKEKNNTFVSYKQAVERFYMWIISKNLSLEHLSHDDVYSYIDFLKNPQPTDFWCGKAVSRSNPEWRPFVGGLSNKSINLNISTLKLAFEYLVDINYIKANPFRTLRFLEKNNKILPEVNNIAFENYISKEVFENIVLNHIEGLKKDTPKEMREYQRLKWIFKFLFLSGCRRSEFVNARMCDFIQKENSWWLKVQWMDNVMEIPVVEDLLNALVEYRVSNNLPALPTADEVDVGLVFSINTGKNITEASIINKVIKKLTSDIAKKLESLPDLRNKFNKFTSNWLKHSSTMAQIQSGISLEVVMKNQRHSNIETTIRYSKQLTDKQYLETNEKFKLNQPEND